ncbi:ACP S-malonyltransferase [Legionella maioricensis]|uniref:Malonyl CoA-acyl carrier protein transacylase n=1 Tax=Legionella maioricensis TaxID=2896528 RepID=A0A9X2CZP8_9GAMM|nr:ACP S-malonyltransferase [Legionella maioricensis]MCL9683773.1 ACP S-malonyltransferase [Legionella maioricensis]MCL9686620.1 ACP S-malonyltransferase [Legionella maioricensis]
MTTYMFPGQGSQVKGMGGDLFSQFPQQVKQANEVLGYSIEELCINDPGQQLGNTQFTQPALYIIEALTFLAKSRDALKPQYCIGHSLGEYSALFAAGAFDFITGLKLVKKRGELMAQVRGGGMLAVIGLPLERIKGLLQENELDTIDYANFNSSNQMVISGVAEDINRAQDILATEASMCIPLRVSGAFHSRYMQLMANEFEQFIIPFEFMPLHTEVISNVTARPYIQNTIKECLVKQLTSSVRWAETISYLKTKGESEFIEIGPGSVLTRLMKQN